eukprot:2798528-Amphidinium_carterae.1
MAGYLIFNSKRKSRCGNFSTHNPYITPPCKSTLVQETREVMLSRELPALQARSLTLTVGRGRP